MGTFLEHLKRLVFGAPIATDSARPQVFSTRLAVPLFGAGVLAAVVYAPDAVVDALQRGGQLSAIPHMAVGVVLIMLLLGVAYRSNVRARPDARADYGLVRDGLGNNSGVVTGGALLVDYLFMVAVSVAAIAHMVTFLVPSLAGAERALAVGVIAVMTFVGLRGIRERMRVVVFVWGGFLAAIGVMLVVGVTRYTSEPHAPIDATPPTTWAVLVAYAGAVASGAVMVTGIEHLVSAGPYHQQPQGVRAGRTLLIAVAGAAAAFLAIMALAWTYRVNGGNEGPVILRVADGVFGHAAGVWVVALAAVSIVFAAASAVFRRFSHLSSLLARDSYLPRQLSMLNDRLVFRGGVLTVAIVSSFVVVIAGADVVQLVHMYVIGVFTAIVLGQVAMVRHFGAKIAVEPAGATRTRLQWSRALHGVAVVVAASVWLVVAVFNFFYGAWVAIAMIVWLVALMHAINRHYRRVRKDLQIVSDDHSSALPSATHGVVLVAQLHRPALRALAYAKAARHSSLEAVGVQIEREAAQTLQRQWGEQDLGVPLVILDSPYRDIVGPVTDYVRSIHRQSPREVVVVYVPEYIVGTWWERFLHNRSSVRLRELLLREQGIVVAAVPWHLESARTEAHHAKPGGAE